MEKEASSTPGKLDQGTHITSIKFVGTVLTLESYLAPLLQRKSYKPVFVHHVVLIPLNRGTIGMDCTLPFAPATSLDSVSNTAFIGKCNVSISIVGCLKWQTYEGELRFRRMYGISARLNRYLVKVGVIPTATHFKLFEESHITYRAKGLIMYKDDNDGAYRAWEDRIVIDVMEICKHFEPIVID